MVVACFLFSSLAFIILLSCCDGKSLSKAVYDEKEMSSMDRIAKVNIGSGLKLYEGDIVLSEDDRDTVDLSEEGDIDGKDVAGLSKRNAERERSKLWHDRTVPYEIASELGPYAETVILSAMDEFKNKTCLTFVPRTSQKNWIRFVKDNGCWSAIGRSYWQAGFQTISIGSGCHDKGVVMHEIMHAIGFYHEQSRPDRNQYIEVFWENVMDDQSHNFNKYSRNTLDLIGVDYDFQSIMHYGTNTFSENGLPTIKVIGDENVVIGQRSGFSNTDVIKINSLYSCHLSGVGWSAWSSYSPCSSSCVKQRQRYCFSSSPDNCPGVSQYGVQTEKKDCLDEECYAPIAGHWGRWSAWSSCSKSCELGTKTRTRLCDDPAPRHGGNDCLGHSQENKDCVEKTKCILGPDDCEFESGLYCHWVSNQTVPGYQWRAHSGQTSTTWTGPSGDHTTGSDYYVYAEASYPAKPGDKTVLSSKQFNASQCRCMSWFYHMVGTGIGELSVFIKPAGQPRRVIWNRTGNQGKDWTLGETTIFDVSQTSYKVQLESVRGPSYLGDIALDDIYFNDLPCGVRPLGCFSDDIHDRALPNLFADLRDEIDWKDLQKTINECACIASKEGYEFYGECWGSKTVVQYDRYGSSDSCGDGFGKNLTNFVYRFND